MLTSLYRGLATLALTFGLMLAVTIGPAAAQDPAERVWIQIESYASLSNTTSRLLTYTPEFDNVNGFNAGAFYAITLGPYARAEAERVLAELRAAGRIPSDSFIQPRTAYTSQFFPVGEDRLDGGEVAAPAEPDPAEVETAAVEAAPEAPPEPVVEPVVETAAAPQPEPAAIPEETPAEARQSEAQLTREERDELQIALRYFGFYTGGIDGAFGPGTRGAMTDWQLARGQEPTGVLTTRQRAQLLDEYATEIARLGYATVTDEAAGIEVTLPMGMVAFEEYNFPFARYTPINDSGLTVLLISQPGDRATLFGLYEIMQTLEIVPLEGERERRGNSFLLTGQSATLRSHTEAQITGGAVKGFTLLWGPERDTDVAQILPRIRESIRYLPGALDPAFVPEGSDEDIDLVSGFEVRRPEVLRERETDRGDLGARRVRHRHRHAGQGLRRAHRPRAGDRPTYKFDPDTTLAILAGFRPQPPRDDPGLSRHRQIDPYRTGRRAAELALRAREPRQPHQPDRPDRQGRDQAARRQAGDRVPRGHPALGAAQPRGHRLRRIRRGPRGRDVRDPARAGA
jgi:peptidoglycan hydrolase-like protein with peptidoglycan-binding domain